MMRLFMRCVTMTLAMGLVAMNSMAEVVLLTGPADSANKVGHILDQQGIENKSSSVSAAARQSTSKSLWIISDAARAHADDLLAIVDHLRGSGSLLVVGQVPFQELLYPYKGEWLSESEYFHRTLSPVTVFRMKDQRTRPHLDTDLKNVRSTFRVEKQKLPILGEQSVAHIHVPQLKGWASFALNVSAEKPADALTVFWAKGTEETQQLAVEWREKDNSRWIARVNLTTEWKLYSLKPRDFRYWHDQNSQGRGGSGDYLHTENAEKILFGFAQSHTPLGRGPHDVWIGDVGMAEMPDTINEALFAIPDVDGLYPTDTYYPMKPAGVDVAQAFAVEVPDGLLYPETSWSNYWRPMGSGYGKNRRLRYIPVVTAANAEGTRAGCLAAMTLHLGGEYKGAITGHVSIEDESLLRTPQWSAIIGGMVRRMSQRTFLAEAGSSHFTYDVRDLAHDPLRVGVRQFDEALEAGEQLSTRLTVSRGAVSAYTMDVSSSDDSTTIPYAPIAGEELTIRAELRDGDMLVDVIEQEIGFVGLPQHPEYLSIRNGGFIYRGKPWRAFGVNYMPSSGLASTSSHEFEFWIEDAAYDPEIVEQDLSRIKGLGMNMVSAFIYNNSVSTGNVLDFLRRCRKHGLLVWLSLRPAQPPLAPRPDVLESIIRTFHLADRDEVMGYDIAWEPWWGGQRERLKFGVQWRDWIVRTYGSEEKAYRRWGYTPEKLEEFPTDNQLRYNGRWKRAVADYRSFVDDTVNASYAKAREQIRAMDPKHPVSFRQSEGANPLVDPGTYPLELSCVSQALDFFAPEAYGIGDAPEKARTMIFARSYGRALAPEKPMIWAEYGSSVWSGSAFRPRKLLLERQAKVFENVLENSQRSRSDGTIQWWYAGGHRRGEDSDYGLFNPDGTSRPGIAMLKKYAGRAKAPAPRVTWKPAIPVDRDDSVRGYVGIHQRVKARFWSNVSDDQIPQLVIKKD